MCRVLLVLTIGAAFACVDGEPARAQTNDERAQQIYLQAEQDYNSGDLLTAIVEWQQAVLLKPTSTKTEQRLNEACEKLLVGGGLGGYTSYLMADIHAKYGEIDEARRELEAARKVFPTARCIREKLAELSGAGAPKKASTQGERPVATEDSSPKTVRAERFELVDAKGNVRGIIATLPDGSPSISLRDSKGVPIVAAYVSSDQAGISVGTDKAHAWLSYRPDAGASFSLADSNGRPRISFMMTKENKPLIMLLDASGQLLWYPQW